MGITFWLSDKYWNKVRQIGRSGATNREQCNDKWGGLLRQKGNQFTTSATHWEHSVKGRVGEWTFSLPICRAPSVYSAISEWVRHLLLHLSRVPSCCRAVFLRICKSLSFNELHIKCDKLGTFQKRGKQYNCDKLGDFWKRELKVIRTQIWNIRNKNETNMRSMKMISLKNKLGLLRRKKWV